MSGRDRTTAPAAVRAARIVLHVTAAIGVVAALGQTVMGLSRLDGRDGAAGLLLDGAIGVVIGIVIEVLALRLRTRAMWVRSAVIVVMAATIVLPWLGTSSMTLVTIGLLVALGLLLMPDARRWFVSVRGA